jgi:hypothetical protein
MCIGISFIVSSAMAATNGPIRIYSKNSIVLADRNDKPIRLMGLTAEVYFNRRKTSGINPTLP